VLILSRFTGAARELTDALLVNPFAPDEIASAISEAIEMPVNERRRRMQRMRAAVSAHNIYRWAGKILQALDGVVAARPLEKLSAPPPRIRARAAADLVHETA
jgi:trehalose 6-phosphate synthase